MPSAPPSLLQRRDVLLRRRRWDDYEELDSDRSTWEQRIAERSTPELKTGAVETSRIEGLTIRTDLVQDEVYTIETISQ
jgi:hypothetical protein